MKDIDKFEKVSEILKELNDNPESPFTLDELCKLLKINSPQNDISFNCDREYFCLKIPKNKNINNLEYDLDRISDFGNRNKGWKVILKSNNSNRNIKLGDKTREFIRKVGSTISGMIAVEKEHKTMIKVITNKEVELRQKVHRGHLIGKQFKDYLPVPSVMFNMNIRNEFNIYLQFQRANCEFTVGSSGQEYFENKVKKFLEKSKQSAIYYEVEAIFRNDDDVVPIGNRIKAISLDKTDDFEDFHVFIPNFQEIGFKDRINKKTGYKFSYAKGFEKK